MTPFSWRRCFESEARASRRNKQPSPVPVRLPIKRKEKPKRTSALPSHLLTAKVRKPFLPTVAVTLSKGGIKPRFDLLNYTQKTWRLSRNEGTPSFRRRHKMFKLFNKPNYSNDQALYSKETKLGLTNSLPSEPSFTTSACHFNFSQHKPHLFCHSSSTVRERLFLL